MARDQNPGHTYFIDSIVRQIRDTELELAAAKVHRMENHLELLKTWVNYYNERLPVEQAKWRRLQEEYQQRENVLAAGPGIPYNYAPMQEVQAGQAGNEARNS